MHHQDLIPHLFRTEFRKITAVLGKRFGMEHLEMAEDIASETFLSALEIWPFQGVPEQPVAWLYTVAKNKVKNQLRRNQLFAGKISAQLQEAAQEGNAVEIDLSEQNISDSQLQMLFAICHPSIPGEAQVGLALRVLCGFGIEEIATAFLTNKETINKRLYRAREKLRQEDVAIELPPENELPHRLDTVLTTLYLLFSEGYYSESNQQILRKDFCLEAMRLAKLLLNNPATSAPQVKALLSLMCFHASRFDARLGASGEMVLYEEQDESLWNQELITQGVILLHQASTGTIVSKYHLEAAIAYWHTLKADTKEKWSQILLIFDHLLQLEYTPVAALNRIYALAKVQGNQAGIEAAEELQLTDNQYYFSLLGALYTGVDAAKARAHFERALTLAKTDADRRVIAGRIDALESYLAKIQYSATIKNK